MKLFKKMRYIFSLLLLVSLLFNITPVIHAFIMGGRGNQLKRLKLLIQRIHEPQWKIGYRYGVECKPEERQNGKALEEAIKAALQAWLKPLRELKPEQPIVDKFVYELQADFNPINPEDIHNPNEPEDLEGWRQVDLRVTFQCRKRITSFALIGGKFQPAVVMRRGTELTPDMLTPLNHEIGHAFGLADTYARPGVMRSRGGLEATAGIQPASTMGIIGGFQGNEADDSPFAIGEDDIRGIVWFYKHFHEDHAVDNCFFADYIYVEELTGCRPKHPLIFETKHNPSRYAVQLLKDDPDIDINAQDVEGMTALHYAALSENYAVVKALLAHKDDSAIDVNVQDVRGMTALHYAALSENYAVVRALFAQKGINPFLRDNEGRSPLQVARLDRMITLLLEHLDPFPLPVNPKGKLTTTWGALKQGGGSSKK